MTMAGARTDATSPGRRAPGPPTEPPEEPIPGAAVLAGLWERLAAPLRREDRRFRLLFAGILGILFTGLMLWYTQGGLLYGMDYVGVYSFQDFFVRPRTDYLIPSLVGGLFGSHIYAGFYASTLVETTLVAFAAQTFTRTLLKRSLAPVDLRAAGAISAFLFLASPVAVSYRYISLLQASFPSSAAFLFALAFFVEIARDLRENVVLPWRRAALFGLALGFTGPDSLPQDARVVALEAMLFFGLLLLYLVIASSTKPRRVRATATMLRTFMLSVPIAGSLLFYPFYSFLTSGGFGVSTVGSVAAAYSPTLNSGTFNTLDITVRLLGRRTFPATPYHSLYTSNPLVYGGSYLWPVLALAVPLLICGLWEFRDRWLLMPMALVAVAGAIWEAGTNPPLGSVYSTIIGYLPYGNTFFQSYSITWLILSKIYPALIAFAIVVLARIVPGILYPATAVAPRPTGLMPRWELLADPAGRSRRRAGARVLSTLVVIFLPLAAGMAAYPVFNGSVEDNFINNSEHGFFIPPEYHAVREQLQAAHGSAILLPQVSTYVKTTWGYNGANGFYENYYYPSQVLVPGFFGPYSSYIASVVDNYTVATNPITAGPPTTNLSVPFGPPRLTTPTSGGLRYDFHTGNRTVGADLNDSTWLTLTFPIANGSRMAQIAADGNLWIGLTSVNATSSPPAWFAVGQGSNAVLDAVNATSLTVSILPAVPSTGTVTGSNVALVSIWVKESVAAFNFVGGPPRVQAGNDTRVFGSWVSRIQSYGMGYVLVDSSILAGALQSYTLVDAIVSTLVSEGIMVPIHSGTYLNLYQIVAAPPEVTGG